MEDITQTNELIDKIDEKLDKTEDYEIVINLLYEKVDLLESIIGNKNKVIKEAYTKANNYLYFNDSADYEVALWEVIRSLRPDLAKKWDNGEDAELKYIGE